MRDIDILTPADSYAATLTTLTDADSSEWEPGAAYPMERMGVLAKYHTAGIPTWVSLEPVLDPTWALEIIRKTHTYVGHYKVGTLNYHPKAKEIDWRKFARDVKILLANLGKSHYLKYDLQRYL